MDFFLLVQAVISVLLILFIMLQQRAAGLTAGGSGMNTMVVQRRGAEKVLYQATIVLTITFVMLTLVSWYV